MFWLGIRQEGLGDLKDTKRSSLAVAEREAIRLAKRKLKLEAKKVFVLKMLFVGFKLSPSRSVRIQADCNIRGLFYGY